MYRKPTNQYKPIKMALVSKEEDSLKMLEVYREPADMTATVNSITTNLTELVKKVNSFSMESSSKVVIEPEKVQVVIDSLHVLNEERLWLHDELESITIDASVLRHKLGEFPRDIEGEIRDAVKSARNSNTAKVQAYKVELDSIEKKIKDLDNEYERLTVSNVTLDPEKKKMQGEHDDLLAVLNQTLADKASMQIKLNETKNKLKDTYARTRDFEEALVELNKDMVEERAEAAEEEVRLRKEVEETEKKVEIQKQLNHDASQKVKELHEQLAKEELELEKKRSQIRSHDTARTRYEAQHKQLKIQLQKEIKENECLSEAGMAIVEENKEVAEKMTTIQEDLEAKLSELTQEVESAQVEYDKLQTSKIITMNEHDDAKLSGSRDKDEAEEMTKKLRFVKDDLLHQTSECARLKRENTELEMAREKTLQDHIATAEIMNKQIQNYQSSLVAERKERQILQSRRDTINKDASDYASEFDRFVAKTTRIITEGKAEVHDLTEKGRQLQVELQEDEQTILTKQSELKEAKANYIKVQAYLKNQLKTLKESIANLTDELKLRTEKYDSMLPAFNELEKTFHYETDKYEKMKKEIVELKTKKTRLEGNIEDMKMKISKMEEPKKRVQQELTVARAQYLEQLKSQAKESSDIETEIYDVSKKLDAVLLQNDRFKAANRKYEDEIEFMESSMKEMNEGKQTVDGLINQCREWLELRWAEDRKLDQESHSRDVLMLDDILSIQTSSSNRAEKVESIHLRMEERIKVLTEFIERVSAQTSRDKVAQQGEGS